MSAIWYSPLCLVLIYVGSALGTFQFPYPQFHAPLSLTPHLIYSSPVGGNVDFAGYSYFTKDFAGGQTEVVFVTGPESDVKMNNEVSAMRDQLSSMPFIKAPASNLGNTEDDKKVKVAEMNKETTTAVPLVPVDTIETSTPVPKDDALSPVMNPTEGTKQDQPDEVFIPEKGVGFQAPYPILRLRGFNSYYPQLSSGFSSYGPSNYFGSQYEPFYNQYSSYQGLYNPLYPTFEEYYNPLFPSLHHNPIFTPSVNNYISGESEESMPEDLKEIQDMIPLKVGQSSGTGEKVESTSEQSATSDVSSGTTEEDSSKDSVTVTDQAMSAKLSELPTSTEQLTEKSAESSTESTTISAETSSPSSSTATESVEPTTPAVVSDSMAVA
ncbi:uncharacterized protein LOC124306456 [Neodiprion virginianus]|uniref:uncharacterized protein LOC124306456 n=1 Tax=Neodiprion virginianus TaxID=2961670 RepID=UPI001EE6BFF5|nr:uncharacterized protein LOC124306456 [Neodiprion virginianus]